MSDLTEYEDDELIEIILERGVNLLDHVKDSELEEEFDSRGLYDIDAFDDIEISHEFERRNLYRLLDDYAANVLTNDEVDFILDTIGEVKLGGEQWLITEKLRSYKNR